MAVPVNIVYPINGGSYPVGGGGAGAAYVTLSFGVTCEGGMHMAEWGVDGDTQGKAEFYDMYSAQYVMKLAKGTHVFWVRANCGQDEVKFQVS